MTIEMLDEERFNQGTRIKVIGVGGGGGNAVSHMVACGIEGVDFICVNTDAQALKASKVKTALQIGSSITKGLGAGADPEIGRQAAVEDRDRIMLEYLHSALAAGKVFNEGTPACCPFDASEDAGSSKKNKLAVGWEHDDTFCGDSSTNRPILPKRQAR